MSNECFQDNLIDGSPSSVDNPVSTTPRKRSADVVSTFRPHIIIGDLMTEEAFLKEVLKINPENDLIPRKRAKISKKQAESSQSRVAMSTGGCTSVLDRPKVTSKGLDVLPGIKEGVLQLIVTNRDKGIATQVLYHLVKLEYNLLLFTISGKEHLNLKFQRPLLNCGGTTITQRRK